MADQLNYPKGHTALKKKESIRVFVHRKHLSSANLRRSIPSQSNSMEQLTKIIERNLKLSKNKRSKNIIVVNYKPVYVDSRQQKSMKPKTIPTPPPVNDNVLPTTQNNRQCSTERTVSSATSSIQSGNNPPSVSMNVPDVEDPLAFIEMMYQQIFTDDGQLRSGAEPTVLANCVKQIVTQSRRNSMVHRDSISSNIHQVKLSPTALSSSARYMPGTFNEEEEESIYSKRTSMDYTGHHHQQQLHAFLNSYYDQQRRASVNQVLSVDDTDNEDFDTFSDLNSTRKTIRTSPPISVDDDVTQTDSKLLSSSGYQSFKSHQPIRSNTYLENEKYCCSNCASTPQLVVTPPASSINILQSLREMFTKYLNFIVISKNILLIPLLIFVVRQRAVGIGN